MFDIIEPARTAHLYRELPAQTISYGSFSTYLAGLA